MAVSYSPTDCTICQEEYNEEERCPRSLPCSHTLCSECIRNLIIRNKKICPFCQKDFQANAVRDIGVNTSLLDVMKLLREAEQRVPISRVDGATTRSNRKNELKRETEEILNELLKTCQNEEEDIDRNLQSTNQVKNTLVQASETIKSIIKAQNEMLASNVGRIRYLEECSNRLQGQKGYLIEKRKQIEEAKRKLATAKTFLQIVREADEAEHIEVEFQQQLQRVKSQLSDEQKTRQKLEKVAKTTEDHMHRVRDAIRSFGNPNLMDFVPDLQNMKIEEAFPANITPTMLKSPDNMTMKRIREGQVYLVQHLEGKTRYARVSISEENEIMIHCLREGTLTLNAITIEHRDVMSLVDPSSRTIFLQFGTNSSTLGRILISLTAGSKRAQNFFLLCNGESGPTYINSVIFNMEHKGRPGEYISTGDYQLNNGKGGKAVVNGAGNEGGGKYRQSKTAGSLFGLCSLNEDADASQFGIVTRDHVISSLHAKFGQVESGLDVLKEAIANHPNIRDVKITDCGVVLDQ